MWSNAPSAGRSNGWSVSGNGDAGARSPVSRPPFNDSVSAILGEVRNRLLFLLYIDPTAGGMLLQVLLGGVAGIAVIVRLFWHRIKSTLSWRGRSSDFDER